MESVGWTKTSGHLDLTDKREYSVCNKHRDYNLKFCICRNWGQFECNSVCDISLPLKLLHGTTQSSSGHHKHVTVPVFTLEELWFNNTRWPICNIPRLSFPSKAKQKLKDKTENSFPLLLWDGCSCHELLLPSPAPQAQLAARGIWHLMWLISTADLEAMDPYNLFTSMNSSTMGMGEGRLRIPQKN